MAVDEREKVEQMPCELLSSAELYFLFSQGLLRKSCNNFYSDRK